MHAVVLGAIAAVAASAAGALVVGVLQVARGTATRVAAVASLLAATAVALGALQSVAFFEAWQEPLHKTYWWQTYYPPPHDVLGAVTLLGSVLLLAAIGMLVVEVDCWPPRSARLTAGWRGRAALGFVVVFVLELAFHIPAHRDMVPSHHAPAILMTALAIGWVPLALALRAAARQVVVERTVGATARRRRVTVSR